MKLQIVSFTSLRCVQNLINCLDPSEYYPGSTDMVRHWQKLGFVAKDPRFIIGDSKLPIWVENERMHIPEETLRRNEFVL